MGFTLIGGGAGTPTPTPTPTQATRTYDTTGANFGLNTPSSDITSGSTNAVGASPATLGTLSANIDGLDLSFASLVNTSGGLVIIYANGSPIITWPVNPINMSGLAQSFFIPIRVLSGVTLTINWACISASSACHVAVIPWQSSVAETITSWTCLGSTAGNLNNQGALITGPADLLQWKQVGILGAGGAKALAAVAMSSDNSRVGSNNYIIDIGIGANPNETLLIPAISPRPRDSTTTLAHAGSGPRRMVIAGGTRVSARAQTEAGTLPDNVNVQVVVGA